MTRGNRDKEISLPLDILQDRDNNIIFNHLYKTVKVKVHFIKILNDNSFSFIHESLRRPM